MLERRLGDPLVSDARAQLEQVVEQERARILEHRVAIEARERGPDLDQPPAEQRQHEARDAGAACDAVPPQPE